MICRAFVLVTLLVVAGGCSAGDVSPPVPPGSRVVALVGGRIQATSDTASIPDGVVLIEAGLITAVGTRGAVHVPAGARVIDCTGGTLTAGFWNSHVHFMGPRWAGAGAAPAERLAQELRAMLTSWGVVRALDIGSLPWDTRALRDRVASGEIPGPAIMMAGGTLVPEGGSPFYVRPATLPEVSSPGEVVAIVERVLDQGADGIKLFTGSWATPAAIVVMRTELVRAATEAAHRRGKFVIAHPSNSEGARAAIDGGVDILAHTFPAELGGRPWDRALPRMMHERSMALVPTLKLFPYDLTRMGRADLAPRVLRIAQEQLRAFSELGGQVLFGTDVGYIADYDPTEEYVLMEGAGLTYRQILAALTTAPAARFGAADRAGRLAPGFQADIVVLDGDPAQDVRNLARVRYTFREGRIIYER